MTQLTKTLLAAGLALALTGAAAAQTAPSEDGVLVTVIFKHDQTMPITEILDQARANGFYDSFPSPGATVHGWVLAMGLGQVVTLKVPASEIRALNRAIEFGAWGAFGTEVYVSYDFLEIAERLHEPAFAAGAAAR